MINSCETPQEMLEQTNEFFCHQPLIPENKIVTEATELLFDNLDHFRVGEVLETLGYSSRYVNTLFHDYYGLPMKSFSNIVHAQAAIEELEGKRIQLAMDHLGYYDQAHFCRNFKKYTSITPMQFQKQMRIQKRKIIV